MVEEQKVEEKAEVANPEPEQPVSETPEEETAPEAEQPEVTPERTAKEKLAEEVKQKLLACAEEKDCLGIILAKFEQVAGRLGIPTQKLIEETFGLIKSKGN